MLHAYNSNSYYFKIKRKEITSWEPISTSEQKPKRICGRPLRNCPRDELYLITPDYLTPYLSYIKNNKRLFRTATENAAVLGMDKSYDRMFRHVFTPIPLRMLQV